jgi:CheY-like chemotaxis protein
VILDPRSSGSTTASPRPSGIEQGPGLFPAVGRDGTLPARLLSPGPSAGPNAALPAPEASGPAPALGPRVLVADDNRDLQRIFAHQLVLLGLEVVGVANGRDAVDVALSALRSGHPFDLILMDLEMPILDGYQATRQVREGGHTGPILALTAHSADETRLDCLRLGCDDCLCKPFDLDQLRNVIRKFLPGIPLPQDDPSPRA